MSVQGITIGTLLVDPEKDTQYRIIHIYGDNMVLCEIVKNKLVLLEHDIQTIMGMIAQNQLVVHPEEVKVFNPNTLSPAVKEKYEKRKAMINEVVECYGPTFLSLQGKCKKPDVVRIVEKYGLSGTAFWKIVNKYLQSGMQDIFLVDQKAFGTTTGKEYNSTKKTGRPSETVSAGIPVDDTVRRYFQEALLDYKSGRQKTLKDSFAKMNLLHFRKTDIVDGQPVINLLPISQRPTFNQFYNYVRNNLTEQEKDLIKTSAREQRNDKRLITSDALYGVKGPGDIVEIDACEADVSLVSMVDNNQTIGRPIVYFMVDVYSRIILAASIAFDNNSIVGLTNLFLNLADDKQEYCNRFGINFDNPALWPSNIIPKKVRVDHGAEFKGKEFERICGELGIERILVPVATGSMKGIVEQSFHQMHMKQNVHLENYGLIEKRHDSKHHAESTLNIYQYTQMVITFVLTHNQQCLTNYPVTKDMIEKKIQPVPALLWEYGVKHFGYPKLITNSQQYLFNLMIPVKAKLNKRGICYKDLWYLPGLADDPQISKQMFNAGSKKIPFEVRIDPRDVSRVYYIRNGKLVQAPLNTRLHGNADYSGMTFKQYEDYRKAKKELLTDGKMKNEELAAASYAVNNAIVQGAKKETLSLAKDMRAARNTEKQLVAKTNRIAPKLNLPEIAAAEEDDIPLLEESTVEEATQPEKRVLETWDDVFDVDWD